MDAPLDRWSLHFEDRHAEMGFVRAKDKELRIGTVRGMAVVFLVCAASITFHVVEYATGMGRRNLWLSLPSCFTALLSVTTIVSVNTSRFKACIAPVVLEWCLLGMFLFVLVMIVSTVPSYFFKIVNLDAITYEPCDHQSDDTDLLLKLIAFVVGVHSIVRLRWSVVWPLEVAAVLAYTAPTAAWSSIDLMQKAANTLALAGVMIAVGVGKCRIERQERMVFTLVAAEKTMRFEMERLLEQLASIPLNVPARQHSGNSIQGATWTSDLFHRINYDSSNLPWEQIVQLGTEEHWLIPQRELHLEDKILGSGAFGMVQLATYYGARVAVKAPKVSALASCTGIPAENLASIADELRVLRFLRHPNIVLFFGAFVNPTSSEIMLALEYIRGTDLHSCAIRGDILDISDRCKLACDVCSALRYLHGQVPCIVHGDIKGSNVLVQEAAEQLTAKLCDFGLSRLLTKRSRPLGGTLIWMAPEVVLSSRPPAASADVFSFGRLLYLTVTGLEPLYGISEAEILQSIHRGQVHALPWPGDMPLLDECQALCAMCLLRSPERRPSMAKVHEALQAWTPPTTEEEEAPPLLRGRRPGQLRSPTGTAASPLLPRLGTFTADSLTDEGPFPQPAVEDEGAFGMFAHAVAAAAASEPPGPPPGKAAAGPRAGGVRVAL